MRAGSVSRRCGCRDETGRQLGSRCPRLRTKGHGGWQVRQELSPNPDGKRRTFRRSGHETGAKAQGDLDRVRAILAIPDEGDPDGRDQVAQLLADLSRSGDPLPDPAEVARRLRGGVALGPQALLEDWVWSWHRSLKLRRTTLTHYESDLRVHIVPSLGRHRLDRLRVSHVADMFADIGARNEEILLANAERRAVRAELATVPNRGGVRAKRKALRAKLAELPPYRRTTGPATMQRIRATLRAALSAAMREQLITVNVAKLVDLGDVRKSKPVVWTTARIDAWRATGAVPGAVRVWTPALAGQFLDHVADHRQYALWHVAIFRGLRRGELAGLRWEDVDLNGPNGSGHLTVRRQLVQDGWNVIEEEPKTEAGERQVALDAETVKVLRTHRAKQNKDRLEWGEAWVASGRVFSRENGEDLHPAWISAEFERQTERAGLPPVRTHDLRHTAATLMLAGGAAMKVVSETLGHSALAVTSDVYTSVLDEIAVAAAEAAVALVPRAVRTAGAGTVGHTSGTPSPVRAVAGAAGENGTPSYPQVRGGVVS